MKKILLALVLLSACKSAPPVDKAVASKFTETREKSQYVYGGSSVRWVDVPYTAYILVATDLTECEVTGREYAQIHERALFSCNWEDK